MVDHKTPYDKVIRARQTDRSPEVRLLEVSPDRRTCVYRHSFTWTKNRLSVEVIRVRSSHSEDRKF